MFPHGMTEQECYDTMVNTLHYDPQVAASEIERYKRASCTHPPARLYSGTYDDPVMVKGQPAYQRCIWIGCLDCHEIIAERVPV